MYRVKRFSFLDFKDKKTNLKNISKNLARKNKIVKKIDQIDPEVLDKMIDELSVEPLIEKYKN